MVPVLTPRRLRACTLSRTLARGRPIKYARQRHQTLTRLITACAESLHVLTTTDLILLYADLAFFFGDPAVPESKFNTASN